MAMKFISCIVKCLDGSCENRGEADIKLISILLKCFPCIDCLFYAYIMRREEPMAESLTSVQPVNLFS